MEGGRATENSRRAAPWRPKRKERAASATRSDCRHRRLLWRYDGSQEAIFRVYFNAFDWIRPIWVLGSEKRRAFPDILRR